MHEITYQYGFDESAGNFQMISETKFLRDKVIIRLMTKNHSFSAFRTSYDGTQASLILYLYDISSTARDSSLDNSILIHEYAHGITSRLTGGQSSLTCLRRAAAFEFMLTMKGADTSAEIHRPFS